jgi:ribosomal protein L44E
VNSKIEIMQSKAQKTEQSFIDLWEAISITLCAKQKFQKDRREKVGKKWNIELICSPCYNKTPEAGTFIFKIRLN